MLSAVILAKNEAANIEACLNTLKWCDERLVIDDFSEDQTAFLAQKTNAKVFKRRLAGDFASQRNFGLQKARGEWVLFIDADERITEALGKEIINAICHQPLANGFYFRRRDYLWGQFLRHGETARLRLLRLAKRNSGQWHRCVHETWQIAGFATELKNPLLHYPHLNLSQFVAHVNFHTTLHAQALQSEGKNASILKVITFPLAKFANNYFWQGGILDGMPGLITALMMSWHSFFGWAKLYVKTH